MATIPYEIAADIADVYEQYGTGNIVVSVVRLEGQDGPAEFYVDVHQPGEGNQRFTVTVTESTDIKT